MTFAARLEALTAELVADVAAAVRACSVADLAAFRTHQGTKPAKPRGERKPRPVKAAPVPPPEPVPRVARVTRRKVRAAKPVAVPMIFGGRGAPVGSDEEE